MKRLVAAIGLSLALIAPARAEPNVVVGFGLLPAKANHEACVGRAGYLVSQEFGLAHAQQHRNGASGAVNDYTINIMCLGMRGVYVIVVAGPDSDMCAMLFEKVKEKF